MIVKDGVFLMMNNKKEKKYILYIPSKKQELILLGLTDTLVTC